MLLAPIYSILLAMAVQDTSSQIKGEAGEARPQVPVVLVETGHAAKEVGRKVKEGGVAVGHAAKKGGIAVGHAVKKGGVAVGHAAKKVGKDVGKGASKAGTVVKKRAKKLGEGVKGAFGPEPVE